MTGFKRVVKRDRIIRKIGLDTDILVSLIDNKERFSLFKPRIFKRENYVFICQKVFSQALGVLIHKRNYDYDSAINKLFSYLKTNNIKVIKNKDINSEKVNILLEELKKQREKIKSNADDYDLEIMAVYKLAGIDCIFTSNNEHFEELCNYLNIDVEKPIEDVNIMWNQVFKKKKDFKKKKL